MKEFYMDDDKNMKKFLKIIGIAALVAVPVFFLVKKLRGQESVPSQSDDANIFADELSD